MTYLKVPSFPPLGAGPLDEDGQGVGALELKLRRVLGSRSMGSIDAAAG